jgi:hypothetical protein
MTNLALAILSVESADRDVKRLGQFRNFAIGIGRGQVQAAESHPDTHDNQDVLKINLKKAFTVLKNYTPRLAVFICANYQPLFI